MKRTLFGVTILGSIIAALPAAGAQDAPLNPQCASRDVEFRDACQKAVDLFDYMLPQLGTAMAGGNPTLGQGGALGGLGHFQVGLRGTAVMGSVPKFESSNEPSTSGEQRSTYEVEDAYIPFPAVDLTIGLFKGLPLGITNVGGLDLIVSAAYVPEFEKSDVSVAIDGSALKLGFGGRLGLIQESLIVPGVSVSYLQRGLPTMDLTASVTTGAAVDSFFIRGLDLSARSWRVVASKRLLLLGLAVGAGQDTYDGKTSLSVVVTGPCPIIGGDCRFPASGEEELFERENDITRTSYFANVSLNLLMLKLVGEVGQVSGGDLPTYNTFNEKAADASRTYASVGLRFGF